MACGEEPPQSPVSVLICSEHLPHCHLDVTAERAQSNTTRRVRTCIPKTAAIKRGHEIPHWLENFVANSLQRPGTGQGCSKRGYKLPVMK